MLWECHHAASWSTIPISYENTVKNFRTTFQVRPKIWIWLPDDKAKKVKIGAIFYMGYGMIRILRFAWQPFWKYANLKKMPLSNYFHIRHKWSLQISRGPNQSKMNSFMKFQLRLGFCLTLLWLAVNSDACNIRQRPLVLIICRWHGNYIRMASYCDHHW